MELSGRLTFATDMLLMPVRDLPDDSRARLDCDADDFAVSRLHGRGGSKIVDAQAAGLLESFRKPRTVIEAVVLFSRERQLDPNEVLESAYPLLRGLLAGGFLVPAEGEDGEPAAVEAGRPTWTAGTLVGGSTIERCLQVLDDTEVYAVAHDGARSVLKVERRLPYAPHSTAVRQRLVREAAILAHLGGAPAAALVGHGEIEGRRYLELELVAGVEATAAAAEWRDRGEAGRPAMRALLHSIAASYAELHRRGIVHGDVHPRNVLVCADGTVRLIDFGAARATNPAGGLPAEAERGGVPFFYEPELAAAAIAGAPEPPPASEAGEQFAVAALLYFLATGAHWRDFSLGRDEMLREIAQEEPLPFRDRGVAAWPELEEVLSRAMAKRPEERYAGVGDLVHALSAIPAPRPRHAAPSAPPLERLVLGALDAASLGGPWWIAGLDPAPRVSVNYGAAGLALGLLQIAQRRGDPGVLAAADAWAHRAAAGMDDEGAFYNPAIEITREMVGESSIYHSPSGVHAVQALVARAMADPRAQAEATARFLATAGRPANGLDLTLGRASVLLGAAILLDALPAAPAEQGGDPLPLRAFGDATLAELWRELDGKPEIPHAGLEYAGVAHGWAGFLYATLQWCGVAGSAVPSGAERRLVELAALGFPAGRGRAWPWVLRRGEEPATMSGWCNGSSGYVFLWTLAHRTFGDPRYLDLAVGAAWDVWDGGDSVPTLCCGAAGRAYALLDLHRHVGEPAWLDRARDLARQAEQAGGRDDYPHSLWKGGFGLAVLAADLDRPEEAAMPLFQPAGYRAGATAEA
jgi:serine/threonine-protein kinase